MIDTKRSGYLRMPTIHGDWIVFTAEDDLWRVPATGGRAERLTAGVAEATDARFSPDGTRLAFTGCDEGPNEVYVMPADGGPATRLTYLGGDTQVVGWRDNDTILFRSNSCQPMARWMTLFEVDRDGGEPHPLRLGVAHTIGFGPRGAVVLGRHTIEDRSHWKGYRGGCGGQIWVDSDGTGDFARILDVLNGHITGPCWVGDRIYFVSDHDGVPLYATANVYSCQPDGGALHRHTHHTRFYVRNLSTDGHRLVFQSAGDLYLLEPGAFGSRQLDIELPGPRTQRARKFVPAASYLERTSDQGRRERTAHLHPYGGRLALTARGKALVTETGGGAVLQLGDPDATRYRLHTWLPDRERPSCAKRLVAIADASGEKYAEPCLVVLTADGSAPPRMLAGLDIGRVLDLVPSPFGDCVALTNHRFQVMLVDLDDLDKVTCGVLDTNRFAEIRGIAWSPDGKTLAYGYHIDAQRTAIKLHRVDTPASRLAAHRPESCLATDPVLRDTDPSFDPDGKYLYFLGTRDFNQTLDHGAGGRERPYAVPLRRDIGSPFVPMPTPLDAYTASQSASGEASAPVSTANTPDQDSRAAHDPCERVLIHAGNIAERAIAFPVKPGSYGRIIGIPGGAVYSRDDSLYVYGFEDREEATILAGGVVDFAVTASGTVLIHAKDEHGREYLLTAGISERLSARQPDTESRARHAVNLRNVEVSVRPDCEWRQMYFDAWRMQRDYFWDKGMNGMDWNHVRDLYAPLLDRIASRGDLYDVASEMQAELRASHAFFDGGDYRESPKYYQGFLGVDWEADYDFDVGGYRIAHLVRGDPWNAGARLRSTAPGNLYATSSPLLTPGLNIHCGDAVLAIDGQPVTSAIGPRQLLVDKAGREVELIVRSATSGQRRRVSVRTLVAGEERGARYRDWVETNRRRVTAATNGCVGYIHIPDMDGDVSGNGHAEFLRAFNAEFDRSGLILDVRWNGGGSISPYLLDYLTRKRVGLEVRQNGRSIPYPRLSPRGPLVALVNEMTSSDAETFSHLFRVLNLGPLIGTRTWGGVIYITRERALTDGTQPTQPQYLHCYIDVGCGIENHGVDPVLDPARDRDKEVNIAPQVYGNGVDPQLERAIVEALRQIAAHTMLTPLPDAANQDDDHRRAG